MIILHECSIFKFELNYLFMQDADCSECYCVWCGRSSDLVSCKSCKTLFCTTCVKRNISEACLSDEVQASCWQCCCCSPSLLKRLTSELGRAVGSENLIVSSSESDSESSDSDNNLKIGYDDSSNWTEGCM